MKKDTTANRLKQIMDELNMRQVDIIRRAEPFCKEYGVKLNKSDLSQYVSGKVEPSQEKLVVLGKALNVQESWLMGLDVPKERKESVQKAEDDFQLFYKFSLLNERDKKLVIDIIELMNNSY